MRSVVRLGECDPIFPWKSVVGLMLSMRSVVRLRECNPVSPGWSIGRLGHLWDFDHIFSLKSGLGNNTWDRGFSRGLGKCRG